MMRESTERTQLWSILNRFANVVILFKKDDVLNFLKLNISNKDKISTLIGDFSDLEIDAWGILEPLFVVMKGVPVYVIAAESDTSYQEMLTEGVAGVFTQPLSVDILGATVEMELNMQEVNMVSANRLPNNLDIPVEIRRQSNELSKAKSTGTQSSGDNLRLEMMTFSAQKPQMDRIASDLFKTRGLPTEHDAAGKFSEFNREISATIKKYQLIQENEAI